jgi:hypothetical protein
MLFELFVENGTEFKKSKIHQRSINLLGVSLRFINSQNAFLGP